MTTIEKHNRLAPKKVGQVSRRNFIKLTGLAAGVMIVSPAFTLQKSVEPQVIFAGCLYRGTSSGLLYQSSDHGHSWQQVMNFGPNLSVVELQAAQNQLVCTLQLGASHFLLYSADGLRWTTEK